MMTNSRALPENATPYEASFAWANFHKIVFYGTARWPSYSYWIVPGTITNEERM
jgi:hypothetical protein